ncbi:hypothetical protein F5X68DRAFT_237558 [Plectosphaerella plurivora]|uniref:Uncharacterized protein n=1 Tax=Plectosphaerella plurivora TaxID=936078 RepID=A0A9P8UYL0_9PEZI|nr:hypothetical protein F5X68DRAFT_237558 [Plectosphaerella plurivora]
MAIIRKVDFFTLLSIIFFFSPAQASLAAWMTDVGIQFVIQDGASGSLAYSFSNGSALPGIFFEHPVELITDDLPKNNTNLSGVGWHNGNMTWAEIFYQDEQNHLVHSRYGCNNACASFDFQASTNLSTILPTQVKIHPLTTIDAVHLGADAGLRVYFHDEALDIHELVYQESRGWRHEGQLPGVVSSDVALRAAVTADREITVVSLKDEHTLQVQTLRPGLKWSTAILVHRNLDPHIPLWKPEPAQFALLAHSDGSMSLFYIGVDDKLHQIMSLSSDPGVWVLEPSRAADMWPPPHPANSKLAIASRLDSPAFRLYYRTEDNVLAEVAFNGTMWTPFDPIHGLDSMIPSPTRHGPHDDTSDEDEITGSSIPESSSSSETPEYKVDEEKAKHMEKIYMSIGVTIFSCCILISLFIVIKDGCRAEAVYRRRRREQELREQEPGVVPTDQDSAYMQTGGVNSSGANIEMETRARARSF